MTPRSRGNSGSDNGGSARPAGSMIGVGIPIGAGFGVALGLVLDNLALGIAIGSAMGAAVGAALEQNQRSTAVKDYGTGRRPLWVLVIAGLTLLMGVALAVLMLVR